MSEMLQKSVNLEPEKITKKGCRSRMAAILFRK